MVSPHLAVCNKSILKLLTNQHFGFWEIHEKFLLSPYSASNKSTFIFVQIYVQLLTNSHAATGQIQIQLLTNQHTDSEKDTCYLLKNLHANSEKCACILRIIHMQHTKNPHAASEKLTCSFWEIHTLPWTFSHEVSHNQYCVWPIQIKLLLNSPTILIQLLKNQQLIF